MGDDRMTHAASIHAVIRTLQGKVGPGDVLLVKGREGQRLTRIILGLQGRAVRCTVDPCRLHLRFCDHCPLLGQPHGGRLRMSNRGRRRQVLLLTTGDTPMVYRLLSCLGASGAHVTVLGTAACPATRVSRFCRRYVRFRVDEMTSGRLVDRITCCCARYGIDIIVPSSIDSTIFLAETKSRLTSSNPSPWIDPRPCGCCTISGASPGCSTISAFRSLIPGSLKTRRRRHRLAYGSRWLPSHSRDREASVMLCVGP